MHSTHQGQAGNRREVAVELFDVRLGHGLRRGRQNRNGCLASTHPQGDALSASTPTDSSVRSTTWRRRRSASSRIQVRESVIQQPASSFRRFGRYKACAAANIGVEWIRASSRCRLLRCGKTNSNTGVRMPVTEHPLHRSVHAELPNTALTLGRDDRTLAQVRVADAWGGQPVRNDLGHALDDFAASALGVVTDSGN